MQRRSDSDRRLDHGRWTKDDRKFRVPSSEFRVNVIVLNSLLGTRYSVLSLLTAFALLFVLGGCKLRLVRSAKNIEVSRSMVDITKNMKPAQELVQDFFDYYRGKKWDAVDKRLDHFSGLRHMMENIQSDFDRYDSIEPVVDVGAPVMNAKQDRARVHVAFVIEKIEKRTGSLHEVKGEGDFVLAYRNGWEVLDYVGKPFWGAPGMGRGGEKEQ